MSKPRLIIVEGAQGVGKGTITNLLREQMPYTNLYRLSGIKDKSEKACEKIYNIHKAVLVGVFETAECKINYILDRSFMSEKVYCNLDYKPYSFENESGELTNLLYFIGKEFDVQFIVLTADAQSFAERLKRDKPTYTDLSFTVQNSLNQQEEYLKEMNRLKVFCPSIESIAINTTGKDPYDIVYDIIHSRD
jgi:thymidylate kinase